MYVVPGEIEETAKRNLVVILNNFKKGEPVYTAWDQKTLMMGNSVSHPFELSLVFDESESQTVHDEIVEYVEANAEDVGREEATQDFRMSTGAFELLLEKFHMVMPLADTPANLPSKSISELNAIIEDLAQGGLQGKDPEKLQRFELHKILTEWKSIIDAQSESQISKNNIFDKDGIPDGLTLWHPELLNNSTMSPMPEKPSILQQLYVLKKPLTASRVYTLTRELKHQIIAPDETNIFLSRLRDD